MKKQKEPLMLHASSLSNKFGNCDGDLLDDYVYDVLGLEVDYPDLHADSRCMHKLIEDFLVPLVPGLKIFYFDTCHNGSRATGDTIHLIKDSDVSVDIPAETVLQYVKQFSTSYKEF